MNLVIMSFNLAEAITIANQAVFIKFNKNLTDIEIIVMKGAWNREEYDQIAAKHQYATSYISQDVAPKLWKLLTEALGEKVKKSNFKEALQRYCEKPSKVEFYLPNRETVIAKSQQESGKAEQAAITAYSNLEKHDSVITEIYVERPHIESLFYETILQPGSLVRIKAPRLMGKTSLTTWVLAKLANQNYRTVSLSLELADRKTHFTNLNKFLRWFCLNISRELSLPNQLDDYWDEEGIGAKVSCTTYIEEYVLAQADSPLVLCLDDVDLLFPYPEIYEDFFGLLRSWYEKARSRRIWKKLRLVIVHATDVYIRLNINQSPFNVGLPIELPELNREQVNILAQQHGLARDSALVDPLINLVGGHPYLLEQAFSHLKSYPNATIEQILADAPTNAGIYSNHLREYWLSLQQDQKLMAAFKTVVSSANPVRLETISAYQLQSMGLVKLTGNKVELRCQLYRNYFNNNEAIFQDF